jgi:hypothetical protein
MDWFYATEEGEMYNSCLLYRRIHLISASWMSAYPIRKVLYPWRRPDRPFGASSRLYAIAERTRNAAFGFRVKAPPP